jgi:hypothetical protein
MQENAPEAHTLLGYWVGPASGSPGLAVIEFQTSHGKSYYAITKEMLGPLASELVELASTMPTTGDFG